MEGETVDQQEGEVYMAIELFGYLGSFLVVFSMLMSSVVKLRVINTIGSIVSGTYALIIGSFPLALMNGCLIVINIYNLIKLLKTDTKNYELITGEVKEGFFKYFIDHYGSDIASFFPDFNQSGAQGNVAYAIMCEENPAGIFLGRAGKNGEINIILDYTTPAYRDCSAGRFLIQELKKQGYKRLIFNNQADKHKNYLDKMGYRKTDKGYIKELQ